MIINVDLVRVSYVENKNVDYATLIFKIGYGKRVSIENSREYWVLLKSLIDGGALKILCNFSENEFIDSSGIGVLIKAAKNLKPKNGKIVITNTKPEIAEIFKIINLQTLIDIYRNESEAINSFRYL